MPHKKPLVPPLQTICKPDEQLQLPVAFLVSREGTLQRVGVDGCVELLVICIWHSYVIIEHCRYAICISVDDLVRIRFAYQEMPGEADLGW